MTGSFHLTLMSHIETTVCTRHPQAGSALVPHNRDVSGFVSGCMRYSQKEQITRAMSSRVLVRLAIWWQPYNRI